MQLSLPIPIAIGLILALGVLWSMTYILILWRGFKDAVIAMPMLTCAMNIVWEFIFAFVYPDEFPKRQINIIWFIFDVGILLQVIRFGAREYSSSVLRKLYHLTLLLALVGSTLVLLPIARDYGGKGAILSGFTLNALISVLYLCMLARRDSIAGQSLYIALFKMFGTVCAFLPVYQDGLVQFLFSITFVLDVGYTLALYTKIRQAGISPWRRI